MDEQRKKAFDFASELAKQLLTLATGIIALTITFSKDIIKAQQTPKSAIIVITIAWFFYLLSILSGIWTLMALAGELEPQNAIPGREPTTIGNNSLIPTYSQLGTFILGTLLIIVFGIISVSC